MGVASLGCSFLMGVACVGGARGGRALYWAGPVIGWGLNSGRGFVRVWLL